MKKIVTLSIFLLIVTTPALVLARGEGQAQGQGQQNGTQQQIQDPTLHEDEALVLPQGNQGDQETQQGKGAGQGQTDQQPGPGNGVNSSLGNKGIEKATQSLNRVAERKNNPEIGEQVRSMVQSHQQIQTNTQTALQNMSQRNKVVKLLVGPDYKNAGQVRSNVVSLRNNIGQLERMKDNADTEDVEDIQTAIDELQTEADELDAQLEEQLSGFSLFGWLAKRFAN